MKWIDATLPMRPDTVHWPGHPLFTVTNMMSMDTGEAMNVTAVSMCSHFGTHIDAPRHYIADGISVDELKPEILIGPCRVVAYSGKDHIPASFIESLDLATVSRLFIKTSNSEKLRQTRFYDDYIALMPSAAQLLVDRGIKLLGVDGYSIGPFESSLGMPVHSIFLGAGLDQAAIEEVDLLEVAPGDYYLISLPMKLTGLEAAPTRVMFGYE